MSMKEYKCKLFHYRWLEIPGRPQEYDKIKVYDHSFYFKVDLDDYSEGALYRKRALPSHTWEQIPLDRQKIFPDEPLKEVADCCWKYQTQDTILQWDSHLECDIEEMRQ